MVKNPARKDGTTALAQYRKHRDDIDRLIDVIQMELDKCDEQMEHDYKNWSRTGSIAKVRSDLMDTLAFVSGMDRELVATFLKEAAE